MKKTNFGLHGLYKIIHMMLYLMGLNTSGTTESTLTPDPDKPVNISLGVC